MFSIPVVLLVLALLFLVLAIADKVPLWIAVLLMLLERFLEVMA